MSQDSREQFEAWASAKFVGMNFLLSGDADVYVQPLTRACYESFQAGKASPKPTESRDQFEQAYSEDNGGLPVEFLKLDRLGESYGTPKVARAWYWWKRARAGVVVVLPEKLGDAYEWGYSDGQNSPNGYSSKEDRDKCVTDLMRSLEADSVKVAS